MVCTSALPDELMEKFNTLWEHNIATVCQQFYHLYPNNYTDVTLKWAPGMKNDFQNEGRFIFNEFL